MKVVYRRRAIEDLAGIHAYIEKDNPAAAARVLIRIRRAIERLADCPYSGRTGMRPETRELVVSRLPYIVVYRLQPSEQSTVVEVTDAGTDGTTQPGAVLRHRRAAPAMAKRGASP